MPARIITEFEGQVAHVRLNRAEKRNALDMAMFTAIADTQKRLAREPKLRAVILSGDGEDFCSGLDVKSALADKRAILRLLWKWLPWRANLAQRVSIGWRKLPVPVISAIHGRCWGGGLQIVLGTDFRILQADSSLSVMESRWGLIPDMGGTLPMRDNMPVDQAMKLAMTAEIIGADEALRLGLATMVAEDALDSARELAQSLMIRSPDAIAAIKRLYYRTWGPPGIALARESAYQARIIAGANQRISVQRERGEQKEFRPPGRW